MVKRYNPERVYYFTYWLYVCSGFWEYKSGARWKVVFYKCYKRFIILYYAACMSLFVIDAFQVSHDFTKISFNMSSSVLVFMKVTEFLLLARSKKKLTGMCDRLENYLYLNTVGCSCDDKDIFRQKARKTLRIMVTFYGMLVVGLPLRVMADTTLGTMGYIIPIPFVDALRPYYIYVYAQQVFACIHFMSTTLAFDLLQFTFLLRFLGHYEVLKKNIVKIKAMLPLKRVHSKTRRVLFLNKNSYLKSIYEEKNEQERVYQLLVQNITHHQKLLEEIKNFSDTYNAPLIVQICGMFILIGLLILQLLFLSQELLSPLFVQQVLYAFTAMLNILYLCSFGSELTSKSAATADALYDTPWYDMTATNMRVVHFALQRMSRDPKLRGGNMVIIERPLCVKYLQFSYNMVTLLRQRM